MKTRSFFNVRSAQSAILSFSVSIAGVAVAQGPSRIPPKPLVAPPGLREAPAEPEALVTAPPAAASVGVAKEPAATNGPQPSPAPVVGPSDVTPFPTEEGAGPIPVASGPKAPARFVLPTVVNAAPKAPPTPPAPPKTRYPFGAQLDIMPVWQTSRGFDLFSTNDVSTRIGLSLDAELAELVAETPILVEIGWTTESQGDGVLFPGMRAKLVAQNLHGGLKLMHRILPFLAPHLRLAGGATSLNATYSVSGGTTGGEYESHQWLAFGTLGAGVTAAVPTYVAIQPGVVIEGGYLISGAMTLKLNPKDTENRLANSTATLGELERSGPYLRFGVFIRY